MHSFLTKPSYPPAQHRLSSPTTRFRAKPSLCLDVKDANNSPRFSLTLAFATYPWPHRIITFCFGEELSSYAIMYWTGSPGGTVPRVSQAHHRHTLSTIVPRQVKLHLQSLKSLSNSLVPSWYTYCMIETDAVVFMKSYLQLFKES